MTPSIARASPGPPPVPSLPSVVTSTIAVTTPVLPYNPNVTVPVRVLFFEFSSYFTGPASTLTSAVSSSSPGLKPPTCTVANPPLAATARWSPSGPGARPWCSG